MKGTKIGVVLLLAIGCMSSAALAEETKAPAAKKDTAAPAAEKKITITPIVDVFGRKQRPMNVTDVAKVTPKVQLAPLRQPLIDRIERAVEKGPF